MWNLKITTGTADRTETVQEFDTREGLVRELESLGVPAGERRKAEGVWSYGDRYEWTEVAETAIHTPDSPVHPDAFAHMVGTVRTDPSTGLNYRVTRVTFKGASRFQRASVVVAGEITENAPRPGHPNATMLGAFAAEAFYTNPVVETAPETAPREITVWDLEADHIGSTITVSRDACAYDGIKATSYTGTLVKLTATRAYVRREGCKTARPFILAAFRYFVHDNA